MKTLPALMLGIVSLLADQALAQTAAVPPATTLAGSDNTVARASNVPPMAASTVDSLIDASDKVGTAVAGGEAVHGIAGAMGESKGLIDKAMAGRSSKLFSHAGNVIQGGQVAIQVANGNYAEAAKKTGEIVLDRCVDAAIAGGCAVISAPTGEAAFPVCEVVAQAARYCIETAADKQVWKMGFEAVKSGQEAVSNFLSDKRQEQDNARRDEQSQFEAIQADDEQQLMALASQKTMPSHEGNDGSTAIMAALMGGIVAASSQPAPVPMAPQGGPCHSGHDESRHPGGCHLSSQSAN